MSEPVKLPILLVDDRPDSLTALEAMLEELDLQVFKAQSGNEALRLSLKHDFAIVLLDVMMPEMDGFETAELMRANQKTRNLPIVFLTAAFQDSRHQFKGYEAGAVDYLLKPVAPAILRSKVKIFCDLYRQRRQLEAHERQLEVLVQERTAQLREANEQVQKELTERIRANEELKRHRDHLEELVQERTGQLELAKGQAEKANRAKSTFLASMSHELRTPLNAILGYAQILLPQQNLTARQRQQLDVMHASGEHLLTLISDILDLSKIEAQSMELVQAPFSLPQLLAQAVEITQVRAAQKGLALQYEPCSALPECVQGDERRVRQILLNLLANAVKFTERGRVSLRLRYEPANGGLLQCEVADTGIGIPQDKLEAIFGPFTQLAPDVQGREGAGLGLTITRRLATLMGGGVSVESQLGVGSTFRFWAPLPVATAPEPAAAEPLWQTIRGYRGARRRVLAVDDNSANAQLLVDILKPLGFEVATAHNGREALRQALEHPPELVLLDLVMPEMDGIETARRMRQEPQLKAARIVGISATVTGSEPKQALEASCDGFLGKPVQVGELLQTVGRLLQLEWETAPAQPPASLAEEGKPTAFTPPPQEALQALRQAAERGDFEELERLLEALAKEGVHAAFCQRLQRLAARYDDDGIIASLDQVEKAQAEHGSE